MASDRVRMVLTFAVVLVAANLRGAERAVEKNVDRSPVDVAFGPDESWLVTANQTSDSVSLLRASDGAVLDEVKVGRRPAAVAISADGGRVLVSGSYSGDVSVLAVQDNKLRTVATIRVGFEPHGIAVSRDGRTAYVALAAASQVAVLDLEHNQVAARIEVGRWPRYLALSPDGTRLAVGTTGDRGVSVVDTATRQMIFKESFYGLNVGHMQISADNQHVFFPWTMYGLRQISPFNIRQGWVLGSRIGRVRLDGPARREAMSLDPQGQAVADVFGLALTDDEQRLVASSSGTHELLVYRAAGLPLSEYGNLDHIDPALLRDRERFFRVPVGGRPLGLRISHDNRSVFVANYLENAVQVVDLDERKLVRSLPLGGPEQPSLARRGEAIFYDAGRSLDQWYSCHSCHYDGGTNADRMDTFNDGTANTFKTILPLFDLHETGPWTWHGWQTDLRDAMRTSLTSTMQGQPPTDDDVDALLAYFRSLTPPPNPFRQPDGSLTAAAGRGEKIFRGAKAGCATCHSGSHFTDGQIHDVGLGSPEDKYQGFNTPTLAGVYRKIRLLHDGRARSLEQLLTEHHNPAQIIGQGELTDDERRDLIEYLKSL